MVNVKNVGHVVRNPPARKASLADAPGRGAWRVRPVCVPMPTGIGPDVIA